MHTEKKIDVCIPVYRPGEKYKRLLKMLDKQTVKINSLICMYTREDDKDLYRSRDIEKVSFPIRVKELNKRDFDHGGTRNRAVSLSDADIVVMMTDDAIPYDERLIESLVRGLKEDKVAVCYARQLPDEKSSLSENFSREFNYPPKSLVKSEKDVKTLGIKAFFCSNVCAAYKRQIFDQLGGFTDTTIFNEDMIFARKVLRSGYSIRYEADARVIHSHDYSNMQQFRRNFDLAVSQKMHPEVFASVSSESEGIRYVKAAYSYMREKGKAYLIIPFIVTSAYKYLGYKLGKNYDKLSKKTIMFCTMNRNFFQAMWEREE